MSSVSVQLGVLVIAKDPARPDLAAVEIVANRAAAAGHHVFARQTVADSEAEIRTQLARWFDDGAIDVVIVLSGESEVISQTLAPLVTQVLPGFTDLFRWLAFQETGASAMLSSAEAAQCGATFVFVVPGAIAAAMDKLILPQFDPATTPRNLVDQLPRLRAKPAGGGEGEGIPVEVPVEKTQGGSGLPSRLPAEMRPRPRTGANIVSRNKPVEDPPTKPIDVARLERQIAKSTTPSHDDVTRPDLALVLPRLPPGASEETDDDDLEDDNDDDHTATDTIAVQPAPPLPPAAAPGSNARGRDAQPRARPPTAPPRPPLPSVLKPAAAVRESAAATPTGGVPAAGRAPARESKPFSFATPVRGASAAATPPREPTTSGTPAYPARDPKPGSRSSPPSTPPPVPTREPTASGTPAYRARSSPPSRPPPVPTEPEVDWAATLAAAKAEAEAKDADEAKTSTAANTAAAAAADDEPNTTTAPKSAVLAKAERAAEAEIAAHAKAAARAKAERAAEAEIAARASAEREAEAERAAQAKIAAEATIAAEARAAVQAKIAAAAKAEREAEVVAPTVTVEAPRARQPTPPPPLPVRPAAADDLPRGAFSYPVKPRRGNVVVKVLAAVAATVLGFFAVVYFLDRKDEPANKVATVTPPPPLDAPAQGSAVTPTGSGSGSGSGSGTAEPEPGPEIEMDTGAPPPATGSAAQGSAAKGSAATGAAMPGTRPRPSPPVTLRPRTGSAAAPATGSAAGSATAAPPTPPVDPDLSEADLCDEANCVLSDYDRPCCDKYKPKGPVISQRIGGVPETLDRSMVRAGVDGIKPRVIACGEKSGVKGTVKIAVVVTPEGAVTSADVRDAPDTSLGTCVAGALRAAKFGKSVEGGSFTYPFVF